MGDVEVRRSHAERRQDVLSEAVLNAAREIAARGDGRMFTLDAVRQAMPHVNAQRLLDAIKTLRDAGRLHGIARSVYELAECYPKARAVSVLELDDGWIRLEVGEEQALVLTPEEARRVFKRLAGDGAVELQSERLRLMESKLWETSRRCDLLARQLREAGQRPVAQDGKAQRELPGT